MLRRTDYAGSVTLPAGDRPSALRLVAARVLTPTAVGLVLASPLALLAIWAAPIAAMVFGGAVGAATPRSLVSGSGRAGSAPGAGRPRWRRSFRSP